MRPKKDRDSTVAVFLNVRVQPRASREGIALMEDGSLKIRLAAPPVDGAANEALVRLLSELLSVPRSSVEIVSGRTSRAKIVRISGRTEEDIHRLLKTRME